MPAISLALIADPRWHRMNQPMVRVVSRPRAASTCCRLHAARDQDLVSRSDMSGKNIKRCGVPGCFNSSHQMSLFRLPMDKNRAKEWLNAIGRSAWYVLVCEEHFKDDQINTYNTRKRLTPTAVPTRRLPPAAARAARAAAAADDVVELVDISDDSEDSPEPCSPTPRTPDPPNPQQQPLRHQSPPEHVSKDLETLVALSQTYLSPEIAKCIEIQLMLTQEKKIIADGNLSDENFLYESLKLRLSFPQTYKLMWKPLGLPSAAGLRRLFRPLTWEINEQWARALRTRVSATARSGETRGLRECAVCVARWPLRPALGYDAARARLRGLDELDGQQRPRAASAAVVVWARAVHARWQQPLACCLLADAGDLRELWLWIDIIVSKLFDLGLKVRALVTDYDERFINRARPIEEEQPFFTLNERQIYRLHIWTEIMIAFRDCLMAHDLRFGSKVASWNDVVRLVEHDRSNAVKLAPGLMETHTRPQYAPPQRRVALALDVLSAPSAGALAIAVERGALPPAALGTAQLLNSVSSLYEIVSKKALPTRVPLSKIIGEKNDLSVLMEMQTLFEDLTPLDRKRSDPGVLAAIRGGVRALLALTTRASFAGHATLPTHAFDNGPLHEFYAKCQDQTLATSKQFLDSFRKTFALHVMKPFHRVSGREDYGDFLNAAESMRGVSSKEGVLEEPVRMVPLATLRPLLAARRPAELVARLLQQCAAQHPDCAAAQVYCAGPTQPEPLLELLVRLERHFSAQAAAEGPTGLRALLRRAADTRFTPPPCPCFPVDFLKTLYMSFRLRSLIEHNNENFQKTQYKSPVYSVNEIEIHKLYGG